MKNIDIPYQPGDNLIYVNPKPFLGFNPDYPGCTFIEYDNSHELYIRYGGYDRVLVNVNDVRRQLLREWSYIKEASSISKQVEKYLDVEIVKEVSSVFGNWKAYETELTHNAPFKHQYVNCFVVLANGKAVGLNENPGKGWSFPVVKYTGELIKK